MVINSSLSQAQRLKQQIQSASSGVRLNVVESADVTGVPAQLSCEQLYNSMKDSLQTYDERIKTDANHITGIAWGLEEADRKISANMKN